MAADGRAGLPWRTIFTAALLGTLATTTAVLIDYRRTGANPLNLIQPGLQGPSRSAIQTDFPHAPLPAGTGHDGQQFYAIARNPLQLRAVAHDLDRPRYRLQRIAYPALAWLLHPSGGGTGLIAAMFLLGVAALFFGGLATGSVAASLGSPPWLAAAFPLLPGSYVSLRISTGDTLALAAAMGAIAFLLRGRTPPAAAVAVVAALTKEVTILVLVGVALARRRPFAGAHIAACAGLVATATWAFLLWVVLPGGGVQIREFSAPLLGIGRATRAWLAGQELWGLTSAVTLALAAVALVRRRSHPLAVAIAFQIALLALLSRDAVGLSLNGTRSAMAGMILSLIALSGARGAADAIPSDSHHAR